MAGTRDMTQISFCAGRKGIGPLRKRERVSEVSKLRIFLTGNYLVASIVQHDLIEVSPSFNKIFAF